MRHIPFLRALGSTKDHTDPLWKAAASGYLVLRFFDHWLDRQGNILVDEWPILMIRERITNDTEVESNLQSILHSIVDVIAEAPEPDPNLVKEPWLAYAQYLEETGHHQLAQHIHLVASGATIVDEEIPEESEGQAPDFEPDAEKEFLIS